jgi:hypothetical protein
MLSNIFDFEAAAAGAEWIDNLARQARQTLQNAAGEYVIGHIDWSVKDFRFENGIVRVIYDWDSLALDRETIIVGEAARGFTSTWHLDVRIAPDPEEARAFVHEYETARGKSFTAVEWNTIAAAATYAMAYSARCEHSLDPRTSNFPEGSYREALARYGASYLAP